MTQRRQPRRPAMLDPHQAEAIVGDEDPSAASELAHASAWAVLGLPEHDFPSDAPARVRALIAEEGIDAVADLWSRSPDFTLPGALWRVFLFAEWLRRDAQVVERRFRGGLLAYEAARGGQGLSPADCAVLGGQECASPADSGALDSGDKAPTSTGEWTPQMGAAAHADLVSVGDLTPHSVEHTIRQLFAGEHSEDTIDMVFEQVAALMRVLATGDAAASVWITSPTDPLAYPVSTRAHALARTAQELQKAAAYARVGQLD